jgi:hypothetical protein
MSSANRAIALTILAIVLASCSDQSNALPDEAALKGREPASAAVQRSTGLTYLPIPESFEALDHSLVRHYPAQLRDVRPRTAVLVDVMLDERGLVRDVAVVDPPATEQSVIILQDVPGRNDRVEREYRPVYDRAFGPAARAALKEVRFRPAIRAGKPVPYTLRMAVEFTSPTAS